MASNEPKISMVENCVEEIIENKNENEELEKDEMKEMTSSSMGKIAGDGIENNEQKAKKSVKFGGWLPEVLDWIKRTELAQSKLSTSSYTFNRYCCPHLHGWKVKPHIVGRLDFFQTKDDGGNLHKMLEKDEKILIPIADINPPEYIIGFEQIIFSFFDARASEFLQKITPLLKKVKILFSGIFDENPQIDLMNQMMTLLIPKINKLEISDRVGNFNQHFPNIFSEVHSICLSTYYYEESDKDLIVKWLNAPMEDGKPKMLEIHADFPSELIELIDCIKEEFIHSVEPTNFIIWMRYYYSDDEYEQIGYEDFKIENKETKEMLELYCKRYDKETFLVRHNKGSETSPKIEWEGQMKQKSDIEICF